MLREKDKKVVIIGAGPGGLAAAMILAGRGFEVIVYERNGFVGGRTSPQLINGYTFELGPTFLMLPELFREIFELSGKKLQDYIDLKSLPVMYRLKFFDGQDFFVYYDKQKLKEEIEKKFPEEAAGYEKWFLAQQKKFAKMYPCLKIPYSKFSSYFNRKLLKALPVMDIFSSLYGVLAKYFKSEKLRIAMTFQAKYLGMSPWACPGPFSILSFIEHSQGIHHPMGGVHKLTEAMARAAKENGAKIILNSRVGQVIFDGRRAVGVRLENGDEILSDAVVVNADFAQAMTNLIPEDKRPNWKNKKLRARPYSCSTFMIYLGLRKRYDFEHHNIFFAQDYHRNIDEIFSSQSLSEDPSFYIQNASITDSSLAPPGKSAVYILVPTPNNSSGLDWEKEKLRYRNLVMEKIKSRTEMSDIEEQIEVEHIITPGDWEKKYGIFNGAVFNLAHTLNQMLYLRPHNEFEGTEGLYLVGGGTHPGSGLPTIAESGRITADLITKKYE